MPAGMPSHPNAIHVVILDSSGWTSDEDAELHGLEDWQETVGDIMDAIEARYPSFINVDEWHSNDNHILLANDLAEISVASDSGWTTVSLAPLRDSEWPELSDHWCRQISGNFQKLFDKMFPGHTYDKTSAWTCAVRKVA